jgi:uncharacterized protein (TIRG00374 family)
VAWRPLRLVVSAGLGVLAIWLAFRGVPLDQVAGALGRAHPGWVAAGVGAVVAATWLRAWRWRWLFPRGDRPPFGVLWAVLLVGQMGNILLPARAGDVARVVLVAKTEGRASAETLTTIALEKVFDVVVFLLLVELAGFSIIWPAGLGQARDRAGVGSVALLVTAAAALVVVRRVTVRGVGIGWVPEHMRRRVLERVVVPVARGVAHLSRPRDVLAALGLSVLTWGAAWFATYACLVALEVEPPALAAVLLLIVLQVGTAVVTTPGGLGIFEYLCVVALAAFGVAGSQAATCGVLLHVVAYLPPIVLGVAVLARWQGREMLHGWWVAEGPTR